MTTIERDYILGTHERELARLGLQHRVWRAEALEGWSHAGFHRGQTLLDVGSGPGFATVDLAEIAGTEGRVLAVDRSRRFLDALTEMTARHGLKNVATFEADLDEDPLPPAEADGAWARWVFAFVKRPRALVGKVRSRLRSGARIVIHEYFHYRTWRLAPRFEPFEELVEDVISSWHAAGGEPDVGLQLPHWLAAEGFRVDRLRPIVHFVTPRDFLWQWPASFLDSGVDHLLELGHTTEERARAVRGEIRARELRGDALMTTPSVVEIVATAV